MPVLRVGEIFGYGHTVAINLCMRFREWRICCTQPQTPY